MKPTSRESARTSREPSVFSDLELARLLDRAEGTSCARFVETHARLSPGSGFGWIEVAGAYAMFDGPASPVTQTFGLGLFAEATGGDLDAIEGFYRERGAPVFHEVSPLAGVGLAAMLNRRGYEPVEFTSVMFRSIRRDIRLAVPQNARVRARIAEVDDHERWAQTAARGWKQEVPELAGALLELAQVGLQRPDARPFLAELDGEPIAAGLLTIDDRIALLAGSSTLPEKRRQGAQLALLESRLRYGAEQGCDIAMMCAAPGSASQRNAERHGFRIAYTRTKWGLLTQDSGFTIQDSDSQSPES